jgi:hypothetical protein
MNDNLKVFENWDKIRKLDVEFHCLDFINNIDVLLKDQKNFFLHTSTIMNYFIITNIRHDTSTINEARSKIQEYCITNNGNWVESK